MPMPVTTTRLMTTSQIPLMVSPACSGRLEQANAEILRLVDGASVSLQPAIGDAEHELGLEHPLQVDAVLHQLDVRKNLVGKLDLADAQRAAAAGLPEPTEEEAGELPQRVE